MKAKLYFENNFFSKTKLYYETFYGIADARQIFHKNCFFLFFLRKTSPGSEKKKVFIINSHVKIMGIHARYIIMPTVERDRVNIER
jgi:hypothetical protein